MRHPGAINCKKLGDRSAGYSPNKVLAVGAERGLLEEARNEAVILHVVDVFLLQRALPATVPQQQLVVGDLFYFFLGHFPAAQVLLLRRLELNDTVSFLYLQLFRWPLSVSLASSWKVLGLGDYLTTNLKWDEIGGKGICNEFHSEGGL